MSQGLKILHVNEHLAWCGGVETYLLSLVPELEQRGHKAVLVFSKGEPALVKSSRHVPQLSQSSRQAGQDGYKALLRIMQEEKPDIAHVHQTYNTGVIRACFESVPTIVTAHDFRYLCPASSLYFRRTQEICPKTAGLACFATTFAKHCLTPRPRQALSFYRRVRWFSHHSHRLSRLIAVSGYVRDRFVQSGMPPERVTVLPYFCPTEPVAAPRPLPPRPTILFIGRVRPIKGYRYFVQALGLLPEAVQGILIGDVSPKQEPELRQLAAESGCADRLEIRPWVERERIADVYHEASVFVFPSVCPETLGIVGLESLACGVPVVASDVGGVREWLQEGKTGLLVPPKQPRALAAAIDKILASESLACEMGLNGISLIREKFARDRHVETLLGYYRAALGRAGAEGEADCASLRAAESLS